VAYFSERELGSRPRTRDEITEAAWKGVSSAIQIRMDDGSFGYSFPDICTDTGRNTPIGTNLGLMGSAVAGEFPYLGWPLRPSEVPHTYDVLDLIEFCYQRVASVVDRDYHGFMDHYHMSYDPERGRAEFRALINRIFARNELVFELTEEGEIIRLAPIVLRETLEATAFTTGDSTLDQLLEISRHRFLSHDPNVRKEGLEKLWDAWERLKTLEAADDKRRSIGILLDRTANEPNFRRLLEDEANSLTSVGNKFMIRHTEVGKIPITSPEHVDYLFHRLFSLIRLALRATERGG
jgi:hypothetical protein